MRREAISVGLCTLMLAAGAIVGGCAQIREALPGTHVTCTAAGKKAQPVVERFVNSIDGIEDSRWDNPDCDEGGMAIMESSSERKADDVANDLKARSCTLAEGKQSTYDCTEEDVTFSVRIIVDQDTEETNLFSTIEKLES